MSFSIDYSELEAIRKKITDSQSIVYAEPLITNEFMKFNDLLSDRVGFLYAVPDKLVDISLNKYCLPSKASDRTLEYEVVYPHKILTASDYPLFFAKVATPTAKFPARLPNGYIKWTPSTQAEQVKIGIRRGKPMIASREDQHQKGFRYKDTKVIKARRQRATWDKYPSYGQKGIRAPYGTLFAPSAAQLGAITYDKDPKVRSALDSFPDTLMEVVGVKLLTMLTKD